MRNPQLSVIIPTYNESPVRIFVDSRDMLKDILTIHWKGWRGEYQESLPQKV